MDFENRTVLVTGASRNIGRATALAFAAAGADVAVHALSRQAEAEEVAEKIRAMGRRAVVCMADTSDGEAVNRMAAQIQGAFGRVDILVLNAAIRPDMPFVDMTYEDWRHVLSVNLDSAFFCIKAFLPGMLANGWGRIITYGGTGALQTGDAGRVHIGASKGGLLGLTRHLAIELGRTGMTVNMISPGSIATTRATPEATAASAERANATAPLGRQGLPEEIAAACLYLASPGAAYVTGQVLSVNGGTVLSL